MNNNHHSEIMKIYDQIREDQKHQLELRKEEIRRKVPEIDRIEKQIGNLCIKVTLAAFQNNSNRQEQLDSLKEEIRTLRMKKSELLVASGYPMDYLEIHYKCDKCNDTGFIGVEKCPCYKEKLNKIYYRNSDLYTVCSENNFQNFNIDYYSSIKTGPEKYSPRDNMKNIFKTSLGFIDSFNNNNDNLLFYGNSGTGKTFLSNCIAKELIDRGYFVVYKTAEELIKNLREVRFNNNTLLEDHLINCDLLIIDDLGTEISSDFAKSELFNILNTKLLRNKKMLVSTNYSLEELSNIYSERITSRLFGNFTLCRFYGNDIRIQKKFSSK